MAQLTIVSTDEDIDLLNAWADGLNGRPVAVDTETTGLHWHREHMRSIQIGDRDHGFFVPATWAGYVERILDKHYGPIVMHNWKFDMHFMRGADMRLDPRRVDCTKTLATLGTPELPSHSLKPLTDTFHPELQAGLMERRLKESMATNGWNWRTVPMHDPPYWQYGAMDVVATARIYDTLYGAAGFSNIYTIEMESQRELYKMEQSGVMVDTDLVGAEIYRCSSDMEKLDAWAREHYSVDLRKKKSVEGALIAYDLRTTETGQTSLAADVLAEIDHPIAVALLARRREEKLRGFLRSVTEYTFEGRVHPLINPLGARTGRMSMQFPNLQQVPRSKRARAVFKASPNHKLILADYDQMELRMFARLSGDTKMREACQAEDPHTEMAKAVWPGSPVTAERRQLVKNVTYAILYGAGAKTLGHTAGIPSVEASELLTWYKHSFSGVGEMFQENEGRTQVATPAGRRLGVTAPSESYKLTNYLVQGASADALKQAIVRCYDAGLGEYMRLPVHDELIFEVPTRDAKDIAVEVEKAMQDDEDDPPLTVHASVAKNWGENYD